MPRWKKAIKSFFKNSDPTNEFFHCAQDGVNDDTISAVEKTLKLSFPKELREFYGNFDGLGLTNDESEHPCFIPPICHLVDFVKSARKPLAKTHKMIAKRYLPVIDWENGDTSGYLLDEHGEYVDALFIFQHELYHADKAQDVSEFLTPVADDLHSFLSE